MKKMRLLSALSAMAILLLALSCDKKAQNPAEFGHFEDGRYQNTYFGLTITLPEDWHVLSKQQIEAMTNVAKMAAGNNQKLKEQYEKYMERTSTLVTAFMYPIPKKDGYNPSFGCTAENMKFYPGMKSGKDFLESYMASRMKGQVKATFPEQIKKISINGSHFFMLPIESFFNTYHVKQKYFVTASKGYFLTFLATYESQIDYDKIDNIIKSIRLQSGKT